VPQTVLVVTEQLDVTADHVVLALEERKVPVFRFDTAEFPQSLTMSARLDRNQSGTLRAPTREISFDEVGGVYWRRPSIYQLSSALNADEVAWAAREARFGMGSVLAAMPVWLNHPAHIARAEYKPVQFANEDGSIVNKPLSGVHYKHAAGRDFIYTQRVDVECLEAESIGVTACLFQQWVEKDYEVRLVAVDGRCFSARIDSFSERGRLDSRTPSPTRWKDEPLRHDGDR